MKTAKNPQRLGRCWLWAAVLVGGLTACEPLPPAEFVIQHPWTAYGPVLAFDSVPLPATAAAAERLIAQAQLAGCGALALTLDTTATAALERLPALRAQFPDLLLLTGLSWEAPARFGRERLTLLTGLVDAAGLAAGLSRRHAQTTATAGGAMTTLRWLMQQLMAGSEAMLLSTYPNPAGQLIGDTWRNLSAWRAASGWSPALQTAAAEALIDQWDLLLNRGETPWGVLVTADSAADPIPCSRVSTQVQMPEQSPRGLLQGLRAGTFWAGQVGVLDDLLFAVTAPGLALPAGPGEALRVTAQTPLQLYCAFRRSPALTGQALQVEFVGDVRSGKPDVLSRTTVAADSDQVTVTIPAAAAQREAGYYVRVQVRSAAGELLAYANPVKIYLR